MMSPRAFLFTLIAPYPVQWRGVPGIDRTAWSILVNGSICYNLRFSLLRQQFHGQERHQMSDEQS
jgi:hypothetical protein